MKKIFQSKSLLKSIHVFLVCLVVLGGCFGTVFSATAARINIYSSDAADAMECCEMVYGCTSSVFKKLDSVCDPGWGWWGGTDHGLTSSGISCNSGSGTCGGGSDSPAWWECTLTPSCAGTDINCECVGNSCTDCTLTGSTCIDGSCVSPLPLPPPPPPTECKPGLVPCGRICDAPGNSYDESQPCTLCHLILMMQLIMDFLFKIAVVVAAFFIAASGTMYIFAAGRPEMLSLAKTTFKLTLLGFTLIFVAWILVNTILTMFGYIDPLGDNNWHIMC